MRLSCEDGTIIESPTGRDIDQLAESLGVPGNTFAVLESGEGFVQVLAAADGVIFQEGGNGELRELTDGKASLSLDAAIDAMKRFAEGRTDWDRGLRPSVEDAFGEPLGLATKIVAGITALLFGAALALGLLV